MEKSQTQKQNQTQHSKHKIKEKPQQQHNQTQTQETKHKLQKPQEISKQHRIWDCDSSLYDSFELNSFQRQLDSAIHSRTMSMPHLDSRAHPLPSSSSSSSQSMTMSLPQPVSKKQSSKFSRSIQKLFKSMFRFRSSSSSVLWMKQRQPDHEYYVVYDKTGALTTIPEVPEIDFGGLSPDVNSLVKRTASERFTAASTVGISCA